MKKALPTIIKIAVSAFILYMLFSRMDMGAFWKTLSSVNPLFVLLAGAIFLSTQLVSTFRWTVILNKDIPMTYPKALSIYFIGMFFNNFLPTIVGGDLIKGYYLYKESGRGDVSVASIFLDRYSGFAALMVLTLIALISGWGLVAGTELPPLILMLIGSFAVASLIIWVGPLHSWAMKILSKVHFYGLNQKIDKFYKLLMSYKGHRAILVKIFIASLFVQSGVILGYFALSKGLGMTVPLGYFFLFLPLTAAVAMLPISLSGLGLREGAFVFLFTRAGATQEQALTLSLLWVALVIVISVFGGIEYIRMGGKPKSEAIPGQEE